LAVAGLRRAAVAAPSGQQRQRRFHLALLTFSGHYNDNGAGMPAPFLFAAVGGERMMARRQGNKKPGP
ncbi:hypothetical protein, partial [Serratia marcescens]|uniref:hypothetical protein n=1 Tax=Serratia marcescens TaxID=615 RepID=UPI001CA355C5